MNKILFTLCVFISLCQCHKDIMLKQGYREIENFYWNVDNELNKLQIKFLPSETHVDTIGTVIIRIRVDQIDVENIYKNPTVKIDLEEGSIYYKQKIIEEFWIPAIEINNENIEEIKLFIK